MDESKDAANVRFFPPGIPLIAILAGLILEWQFPLSAHYPIHAPLRVFVGIALAVLSVLGLGFWSVRLFRKGGQSENPWKPTTHIETNGPFRFSRNPMYLQMVLVCMGVSIALGNFWIMGLVPCVIVALHFLVIRHEEAYLETKFGDEYLEYKNSVRRWF